MLLGTLARLLPRIDVLRVEAGGWQTCSLRFTARSLQIPWRDPRRGLIVLFRQALDIRTVDALRK